jgi:hypothetical protein
VLALTKSSGQIGLSPAQIAFYSTAALLIPVFVLVVGLQLSFDKLLEEFGAKAPISTRVLLMAGILGMAGIGLPAWGETNALNILAENKATGDARTLVAIGLTTGGLAAYLMFFIRWMGQLLKWLAVLKPERDGGAPRL